MNPQTTAGPAPIQLEKTGITPDLENTELGPAVIHKKSIAAKLRESGRCDLSIPLEQCGNIVTICHCRNCGQVHRFTNRCDRFYCPTCQPKLAWRRRQTVAHWTRTIQQPKHLVLTSRNSQSLTGTRVKWFKAAWSRLRQTNFTKAWRGGLYALEVTNESKGWHLHLHALVDADWIDSTQLATTWSKQIQQDFAIVKVKDARDKSYLQEVTKYAVKGSQLASWKPWDIVEFIEAFDRNRTFGVFGTLFKDRAHRQKLLDSLEPEPFACTNCQGNNLRFYSDQEWEWYQTTGQAPR